MKHRVDQRIQQAAIENPNNEHLKNQRIKIHQHKFRHYIASV